MDTPIERAVAVFYANPSEDMETLLVALYDAGLTPREAWELYQFLPIAFVHVAYREKGVVFTPDYELDSHGVRTRHQFVDEPIYVAGVKAVETLAAAGGMPEGLRPVFEHSSEHAVIRKLTRPDGSVDGIGLTEPILFEYEE